MGNLWLILKMGNPKKDIYGSPMGPIHGIFLFSDTRHGRDGRGPQRKWQGSYMAHVLNVTDAGIRIKHLEDDFEETLPLDALGGGKYLLKPVDSDEEEETSQAGECRFWIVQIILDLQIYNKYI
jgi:hypothetical protein